MLIDAKNGAKVRVLDARGKVIPYVQSYDTVTREITFLLPDENGLIIG